MDFPVYLAMTAAEIQENGETVPHCAWMSCHFSPYGAGLIHCPPALPEHSLLILNDRIPIHGHEPEQVIQALEALTVSADGLLLDFERPGNPQTKRMIQSLLSALSCPILVSESYAKDFSCPVFLSALPLHIPLRDYLASWQGREIWLEAAPEAEELFLTEKSCEITPLPWETDSSLPWHEDTLFCEYGIQTGKDWAKFLLARSQTDVQKLLSEAHAAGVRGAVGFYEQLGDWAQRI